MPGHPQTLQASHPGNLNAVRHGVYSGRVLAPRAREIADALMDLPHGQIDTTTAMTMTSTTPTKRRSVALEHGDSTAPGAVPGVFQARAIRAARPICAATARLDSGGRGPMIGRTTKRPGGAGTPRAVAPEMEVPMRNEASGPARRVSVPRHPGVFYRDGRDGRRYELWYRDSTGTRRWKTVSGTLRDAIAAREELQSRVRRGERVVPSSLTFAEFAEAWLADQHHLRPKTLEWYSNAIRRHLVPRIGRRRVAEVNEDDVVRVIAEMRTAGYAPWTIKGVVMVAGRVMGHAARRGLIPGNPVRRLERGERPSLVRRDLRVLNRDEVGRLLEAADPRYRPLLAVAVFGALRLGEVLGLVWADVDFGAGVIRVRRQLDRAGNRIEPKTAAAKRDVIMAASLARMLREHRIASRHSQDGDPVFASSNGGPLEHRNVAQRALRPAVQAAGLGPVRFHDLRHCAASTWIERGLSIPFVARMLGHSTPAITLGVYSHVVDHAEQADRAREALEAAYGV